MMRINDHLRFARLWGVLVLCLAGTSPAGSTVYVDDDASAGGDGQTWTTAFTYFQDALAAAAASGGAVTEIRVAAGTYKPDLGVGRTPGDRTASFQLIDGTAVRGGYAGIGTPDPDTRDIAAHQTVLSGDLADDDRPGFANNADNSYHVATCDSAVGSSAVLDGVVIRAGNANGPSGTDAHGGGFLCHGGQPALVDVQFFRNYANYGAGM